MEDGKLNFEIIETENGEKYLRRYDDEFKMWVNIYSNPDNDTGVEYIKNALRDIFLQKIHDDYGSSITNYFKDNK